MKDKDRALMYGEVDEFLNHLGSQYIDKIPEYILRDIRIYKDKHYQPKIKGDIKDFSDIGFSHYTLAFIAYLNMEYWVEDEKEKQELKNIYEANTIKQEEEFEEAMNTLDHQYVN